VGSSGGLTHRDKILEAAAGLDDVAKPDRVQVFALQPLRFRQHASQAAAGLDAAQVVDADAIEQVQGTLEPLDDLANADLLG
jgi:hypothetical protein